MSRQAVIGNVAINMPGKKSPSSQWELRQTPIDQAPKPVSSSFHRVAYMALYGSGVGDTSSGKETLANLAGRARAEAIAHMYKAASERTGFIVQVDAKYGYLPVVVGVDQEPVLLFNIVEEVEGIVDLQDLKNRFPTLSLGQLAGVFGFLRFLSQFNRSGIDIDAIEDRRFESDPEFQDAVKQSLNDKVATRVLASQ